MFDDTIPPSTFVFWGIYLAVILFGGGALLLYGVRVTIKTPRATYWRSVWAMLLGISGSAVLLWVISFLATLHEDMPLVGLILVLLWTWVVVGRVFKISFGKSIKACLPVLVLNILLCLPFTILLPAINRAEDLTKSATSASNLHGISTAMLNYMDENDDSYPPLLDKLVENGSITEKMLHYPAIFVDKSRSYFYLPPKNAKDVAEGTIIACEKKNVNTTGKGRNVLFADGKVKFLAPEKFAAELAKPRNAAFAAALKQADKP